MIPQFGIYGLSISCAPTVSLMRYSASRMKLVVALSLPIGHLLAALSSERKDPRSRAS